MKKLYTKNNKLAGVLYPDGVFRKKVSARKHLFKKMEAWGIDYDVLMSLPNKAGIRILDLDSDTVYFTTAERFKHGSVLRFKDHQIDHGTQVFFPLKLMGMVKNGEEKLSEEGEAWWEGIVAFDAMECQCEGCKTGKTKH